MQTVGWIRGKYIVDPQPDPSLLIRPRSDMEPICCKQMGILSESEIDKECIISIIGYMGYKISSSNIQVE